MEIAIVGAGVVGLACAAALSRRGHSVTVLERNRRPGQETSSRNSGVIHAGLYYPRDSLKAALCTAGRARLYEHCARMGVPHRRTGKLLVATESAQLPQLEGLYRRALENGAGALAVLDAVEVRRREPRVRAVAALWSPETGIVDPHELMKSLAAVAERHGATVVSNTEVVGLERVGSAWQVATLSCGERCTLAAPVVVNAAGLAAPRVAALAGIDAAAVGFRLHPCKGDYFTVSPSLGVLTRHLVYPLPGIAGLGIHVTFDLGGRFRLGPDTEYVAEPRYDVEAAKAAVFAAAVAPFLPEIEERHLSPDYAGVRPKLQGPGVSFADFVIEEGTRHDAPGLVNLVGIESPGLTASLAIGERVAEIADELDR